jgi:glycosyltransferase involved in cell wall biosynthesis
MKIAFVTATYDPKDIRRGSGIPYYMYREIQRQGHHVHAFGPINVKDPMLTRIIRALHWRFGKRYKHYLDPFVGKRRGRIVARRLRKPDFEVLITNDHAIAGYTKTTSPIVLYTDVMIPKNGLQNVPSESYRGNLSAVGIKLFQRTIRRSLKRASLCVFPAQAAADEAVEYIGDTSKVKVIPWGANIEDPGDEVARRRRIQLTEDKSRLELLFVGKDWLRKGGDIAVETTNELNRRGITTVLHVVGTELPYNVDLEHIKSYGRLDKTSEADRKKLIELYCQSEIFILPTQSEGFGIVFAEAAAYGLPALAYDIDSIRKAIVHEKTGILLPLNQSHNAFADVIEELLEQPSKYRRLAINARKYYENSLNWNSVIGELVANIEAILWKI